MPKSVLDFDKKGSNKKEYLPPQNAQRIEQTAHSLKIKTGFSSTPGVTLSFTNGTRTFTITPSGSSFDYWIEGIKYTKISADTVVIDDTEGLWFIYYVGTVLTASQVEWIIKDGDKALVGLIHWDATNNVAMYIGYEVHSHDMSPATHSYLHRTIGTNFVSGLALVEGTGGDDGKVAMDSGEIRDEDIHIDITDGAGTGLFEQELGNTSVFAPAQIPVFYRSGTSAWRKYTATDYPFYDNAGVDNVHYNSYSDPNWASTEAATSAKYIAYWIFGTNDQNEPIIAIMGQVESLTLNAAKEANTLQGIDFGTLPFQEMKILYRLIFKSDSTHAHTEDLRQVINVPGGTYVPAPSEVSDEVYGVTWDGVTTLAPSKNVVYDKIELVVAGGAQFAFKTITGITNDVIADLAADTLTYTSANGILTIVGTSGTDTITFTIVEGQISLANLLEKNHASLLNKNAEANIKHLTDAQLGALHTIYSLEEHNNAHHNPNYANELIEIIAGTGLTGGGTLQANRTINCSITQYTDAMVDAIVLTHKNLPNAHHVAFVKGDADALYSVLAHLHDDRYYTETEIGDKVFEQSDTFPAEKTEGDLHYDEVLDSLYRYNGEAEAWVEVGVGGLVVESIDNLGNHTATQTLNMAGEKIDNVSHIQSDGAIYLAPVDDEDDELVINSILGSIRIYQEGATEADEAGILGHGIGVPHQPFFGVYTHELFTDDGNVGAYSHVDDLQLLRELQEYEREKVLCPEFPNRKQKVWDVNTLPWVKAHPEVDALPNDSNIKRYSMSNGARDGYFLSTMKKLLEKIDMLETRISELEDK